MAGVEYRGPYQFRARVRRNGVVQYKTFDTRAEAERWGAILEGKIIGDEYQDRRLVRDTTLRVACEWLEKNLDRSRPDAKNKISKLGYWQKSEFADWSLVSIRPADLIHWRRDVLDEDDAEDGQSAGPEAAVGPQTVVHRLNVLSQVYKRWALAHDALLTNPVVDGVRPSLPEGRNRRLSANFDANGEDEETRLLKACAGSSRAWLTATVTIAIETCLRQSELAGLTWDRVRLRSDYPHCDLPRTKNDRPRRVPLSLRAVAAFESLMPAAGVVGARRVLPVESGRGIAHAFRDAVTDADFPNLRWHDLRHEAISRLFELTDLRDTEIMAISGHLRPEMLARYTHLRADRLGERLPGGRLNVNRS
jgi:integrase